MYDYNDIRTLRDAFNWIKKYYNLNRQYKKIVYLVGNKYNINRNQNEYTNNIDIDEEVYLFQQKYTFKCSVLLNYNIDNIINNLINELKDFNEIEHEPIILNKEQDEEKKNCCI